MLFKIDENLPVELAELLSDLGHDAKTVNDQRLQGVTDQVLLERFLLERCDNEKRTLVTLDIDFSDIRAYPPQDHEGVILLRLGNQSKGHVLDVFKRILPLIAQERIKGRLWIVEENTVRIRGEAE
jgi:predicted nuclease of predicted toxin-antitoxin system